MNDMENDMQAHPQPKTPPPHATPLRRRRLTLIAGAVLVAAAGATATLALADKTAPPPPGTPTASPALTVETLSPKPQTLARTVAASGSVAARDELLIGSDANGIRLVEVRVEVGSVVQRGQLLARGDDSALLAQLHQQNAQIRQAEVDLAQAQANLERAERVRDAGVYSAEAIQTRRSAAESAAAKLDLVRAQRDELNVHLARTRVLAPADGVVSKKTATQGAVMQPGLELFRLIRGGELEWLAELPAASLAQVQPGAVARVRLDDGQWAEARVRLVAPTLDARSRNGLVHVTLPRGAAVKAGAFAAGEIVVGHPQVLTLPESAVFQRDGESFVYLLGAGDVARRQRIETGARQRGLVEVRGLAADARVVATGAGFVKDGERVRVAAHGATAPPDARTAPSRADATTSTTTPVLPPPSQGART